MQGATNHFNLFSTQGQSVLSSVSESTGTIFCTDAEVDLANLVFIDCDNDYEDSSSLFKKIMVEKGFFNTNTESVVELLHSYARGKYQFPYLYFSSSPRFIALRAIII
jgi:hypothetical protein